VAATRFEIQASGPQTTDGNGGNIAVAGIREMVAFVDVTASGGTTPSLSVWLQSSSDGGTTWYDLPYEVALLDANTTHAEGAHRAPPISAASGSAAIGARNIVDQLAASPAKAVAVYRTFGDVVRGKWKITGTTPTFTFSIKAVSKT